MRVTHLLSTGLRGVEVEPGVLVLEGHVVQSMASLARRLVTVHSIETPGTIDVTTEDIDKAKDVAESLDLNSRLLAGQRSPHLIEH
jgi:hypothetical protein